MRRPLLVAALLLALACHRSGTWVDDRNNFERAWGVDPPHGVRVIRSWYWRSAHFTREEIYYFHLRANATYAEAFAAENRLRRAKPSELGQFSFTHPKPAWFAPKAPESYEIWSSGSQAPSAFILLERATGNIFVHVAQL